jgi:hypothetical protein
VHVYDKNGRLISRVNLDTMRPVDIPRISGKVLALIRELKNEGRP